MSAMIIKKSGNSAKSRYAGLVVGGVLLVFGIGTIMAFNTPAPKPAPIQFSSRQVDFSTLDRSPYFNQSPGSTLGTSAGDTSSPVGSSLFMSTSGDASGVASSGSEESESGLPGVSMGSSGAPSDIANATDAELAALFGNAPSRNRRRNASAEAPESGGSTNLQRANFGGGGLGNFSSSGGSMSYSYNTGSKKDSSASSNTGNFASKTADSMSKVDALSKMASAAKNNATAKDAAAKAFDSGKPKADLFGESEKLAATGTSFDKNINGLVDNLKNGDPISGTPAASVPEAPSPTTVDDEGNPTTDKPKKNNTDDSKNTFWTDLLSMVVNPIVSGIGNGIGNLISGKISGGVNTSSGTVTNN